MSVENNPEFLSLVKRELNACLDAISRSQVAFISTIDGHMLIERSIDDSSMKLICPMTGSLIGLAEALAKQLQQGDLSDAIIRTENSVLTTIKLNDSSDSLLLGIFASRMVNLGMLVTQGRKCANNICEIIEE